jgi:cbb3-type cytochrome oxidase cytochrome c subunit
MRYRDADWTIRFLKDPQAVWPAARKMPNLHLKDQEIADVVAFLTWVNSIDTNNWPPKPMMAAAATGTKPGETVYKAQGCSACHRIGGVGGTIGPDLSGVGRRRDKGWILQQLTDPKSHDPKSVMPSFARLAQRDREDLAEYLVNLK